MNLNLSDIAKAAGAEIIGEGAVEITGVSTDTRTIKKGDLFIALSGENFDGHNYVSVAEQNGAVAAVCLKEVEAGVPVLMVEDTLKALQAIAAYYRSTLPIKVIGVTGSNGKTTTRNLIASVLSSKYSVYSTKKNFNNEIGLPKSVLELDGTYDIAVLEMGMNHLGEISALTNVAKPDIAVITNVGKAHIGNLGSQENILKAKLEILEGLAKDGRLIINGDDMLLSNAETGSFEKTKVGFSEALDIYAKDIKPYETKTEFTVVYEGKEYFGSIPLLGAYNVANFLEAVACGLCFGIGIDEAFRAAQNYKSEAMRTELSKHGGISIIKDCYNSSPDSARVALETLANLDGKRKVAVLGEMLELGEYSAREHFTLGEQCVKNKIYEALFIGADCAEFKKAFPKASCFMPEEREAFLKAVKSLELNEGDAVLIKGSRGMKMEEAFEELIKSVD